jgi:hypothetical protein
MLKQLTNYAVSSLCEAQHLRLSVTAYTDVTGVGISTITGCQSFAVLKGPECWDGRATIHFEVAEYHSGGNRWRNGMKRETSVA